MEDKYLIEVSHVTKKFKVYLDRGSDLKDFMLFRKRRRYENREVLKDISFKVKKGEAVGLIGHNGCGKSTTLKLLTRIMYPDSGTITMRGRVSSLIELGAGFHPDMSGRENIYINASIFGLTKEEIDERLDDIIAFSELEEFIDNPVRTYSSGMYMRLAFSVAINVNADILLIDEILAVGDANFQAKCFNKMREIKASGTTIVLVSHSMGQIEQLCDRSIWINDGKIVNEGPTKEVDLAYLDYMNQERQNIAEKEAARKAEKNTEKNKSESAIIHSDDHSDQKQDVEKTVVQKQEHAENRKTVEKNGSRPDTRPVSVYPKTEKHYGDGRAAMTDIRFVDSENKGVHVLQTGSECTIEADYHVNKKVDHAVFGIGIFRNDGLQCYGTNTRLDQYEDFSLTEDGCFKFHIPELNLIPSQYWIDIAIESDAGIPVDYFKEAYHFEVVSPVQDVGISRIRHNWDLSVGAVTIAGAKLDRSMTDAVISCDYRMNIADLDKAEDDSTVLLFPVTIENKGKTVLVSRSPFPVNLSYHTLDIDQKDLTYNCIRTELPEAIKPGESSVINLRIAQQDIMDAYYIQVDLVQEGNFWFQSVQNVLILK